MKRSFNAAQVPQAIALESVQVASPCHADWDAMRGDDRSRFCPSCAKNVYNLSAMTRGEAELLLQEKEGRLCVRFFQREDGTMLTQDCPVGAAALKERSPSFALWAGVASLLVLVAALVSPAMMTGAHAQPEPSSEMVPAQNTIPAVPPLRERIGDMASAPATPMIQSLGESRIVPSISVPSASQEPAKKPAPPTMGKPVIPKATPTPQAPPITMGRVATPHAVPEPTRHKPVAPLMGLIKVSPPPPSPKKPTSASKKNKVNSKKQR